MAGTTNTLCAALVAVWSVASSTPRYYAADYNAGSDGNIGYSDVSMQAAGTVAVKTLTRLKAIVPPVGVGQILVIAVNGNADGITDLQYLKPDGVTLDDLDLRGLVGYRVVQIRTTNGFSGSATDKKVCSTAVGQAGPGVGGVWTCAAGATTNIFTVSAGTLTTEPGLNGFRVRFTGNVTAALLNQAFMLQRNTGTQITLSRALTVAPAIGDTFVIEQPGVSVDNIFISSAAGGGGGTNIPTIPCSLVGFRARQTTLATQFFSGSAIGIAGSFLRFDASLSARYLNQLALTRFYTDELNTLVTPGCGARWAQASTVNTIASDITGLVNLQDVAITSMGTNSLIVRANSLVFGAGSYINTSGFSVICTNCNNTKAGSIGSNSTSAVARMALFGKMSLISTGAALKGIDCNSAGASPCFTISDIFGLQNYNISELYSSSGGNTDVVIDTVAINSSVFVCTATLTPSMATLGDIRTFGGVIIPFTTVTADLYLDGQGNEFKPTSVVPITRRTPGIFYNVPILTADPATLIDGDVWITNIATVRNLCVRIASVTYRSLLA